MSTLVSRIERAERDLLDTIIRLGVQRLASETGKPFEVLYAEAQQVRNRFESALVRLPDGTLDIDPAVKAAAKAGGRDEKEIVDELKGLIRHQRTNTKARQ